MSVDGNNWKSYHFGDIAQNIIERAMPVPDDKEKYIGLEHMDSGSLHISRWGSETELIGEKLRIKKGDMLFARRNAYLKRVAVAPFDGIFSAHGMVLRPNTALIAPGFFPFFMLSDMFLDEAIRISVGSLSPTVNWGTLKKLQFSVPPIEEQKRVAEVLWAADKAWQRYNSVLRDLRSLYEVALRDIFIALYREDTSIDFASVGQWKSGGTPPRGNSTYWNGDVPWVSPKDMKTDEIYDSLEKITQNALHRTSINLLPKDSIIFVVRGMILAHAFPVAITRSEVTINQDMKAIIPSDSFNVEYLFHWLKYLSSGILSSVDESSHGTKRLSSNILERLKVPLISLNRQYEIVEKLSSVTHSAIDCVKHLDNHQLFMKSMLNHYLGGAN